MHRHSRYFASLSPYIYPSLSPSHSLIHSFPLSLLISVLPLFLSLFLPPVSHLEFISFPFPSFPTFHKAFLQTDRQSYWHLILMNVPLLTKHWMIKIRFRKKINLLSFEFWSGWASDSGQIWRGLAEPVAARSCSAASTAGRPTSSASSISTSHASTSLTRQTREFLMQLSELLLPWLWFSRRRYKTFFLRK